jgi:PAS domain S-box-containing protein
MSEARLRAVLETATDGIIAANPEGRIVIANASATRLFGLRRREAVGRNLSELFTDPGRDTLERSLIDIRRATPGRQSLFEVAARTPDGGAIPLEVAVSVMAHEGELLDILVLRDLRDRRRAEAEREQLQTRLAQSLRMESLGRLVSGVAHELNNPLAAILTFSEQLLAERAIGEEAGPLTTIREQARRARAIVRDLLAFVRRREDRREAADLAVLVDRTVRALQGDIDRGGVKLTVELAPNLPLITCNPPALEQVLTNLVDNAVRAAPRGKVELRVRQDQGCLEVEVNDSGPGIRPEHLSRIFEPFFTTRATGEGTGLGLSVSLGILQQHGGDLRAENRLPGPGARFVARIPVGGARPPAGAQPPADRPVLGGGRRVLIIDDEEPIRSSLRRYFMRQDWAVDEAADGSLGLARMLDGVGYDLVICDLKMPGLSGAEVYHQVRVARPDLLRHLVFASGDTASPETAAFLDSTSTPVLEKPFELSELRAVVDRVLNLAD